MLCLYKTISDQSIHSNVNPSNPIAIITNSLTPSASSSVNSSVIQHGVSSVLPPLPPNATAAFMIQQPPPLSYHHNLTSMAIARTSGGEY